MYDHFKNHFAGAFCLFAALCFFGAATSTVASAETVGHPTHVCRGEIDFNPDTQCLEFAVCLYLEDVRTLLHRKQDAVINFAEKKPIEATLQEYLHNNFWVATSEKNELPIQWYGFEIDREGLWMYFEVPLDGQPEGLVVGNRMLLEIQPGNVSVFRYRWGEKRCNQLFNSQTVGQRLVWLEGKKKIAAADRSLSLTLSQTMDANDQDSRGGQSGNSGSGRLPEFDAPPQPRG